MILRHARFCLTVLAIFGMLVIIAHGVRAEPLETALVHRSINNVLYYEDVSKMNNPDSPVEGKTVLRGDMALKTGEESSSELIFNDNSLLRMGSYSLFSFASDTRELRLPNGSLLYQLPKGSKTTRVRMAGATVGVLGTTVMLEHKADHYVKVIVLEGTARVFWKQEHRTLKAGQMLLFSVDARTLPRPAIIDLAHLVETAQLIQGFENRDQTGRNGPENRLDREAINRAIQEQRRRLREGTLRETGVRIRGGRTLGTEEDTAPPIPEQKPTGEDLETVEERMDIRKLRHEEPAEH